jgi:hypothetical protein
MLRILHLTLTKEPFEMIASGVKLEEYRTIKPYWWTRLTDKTILAGMRKDKEFDIVRFKNGYGKNAPEMDVQWKGMEMGVGKKEWGASGNKQFIIKLGKVLSIKNYK